MLLPRQRRVWLPGSIPRIDWNNELTLGLKAFYVPGACCNGFVYNLTGLGGNLQMASASAYDIKPEGKVQKSIVASSYAAATTPAAFKFTDNITLYWRGYNLGSSIVNSANLIGVEFDNANTTPSTSYVIGNAIQVVQDIALLWANGGAQGFSTNSIATLAGQRYSVTGTFSVAGNATLYSAGKQIDATVYGGSSPTYASTSQISMGGFVGDPSRATNCSAICGGIWNRILKANEISSLDKDPFQFLIFPEDDMMDMMVGIAAATGAVFRKSRSRIGTRVGTRQGA